MKIEIEVDSRQDALHCIETIAFFLARINEKDIEVHGETAICTHLGYAALLLNIMAQIVYDHFDAEANLCLKRAQEAEEENGKA